MKKNIIDNPNYTRAMRWLRGCQAQTPSVEEVIELIRKIYSEGYVDGYEDVKGEWKAEEGYRTAMEIIKNGSSE